MRRLLPLVIRVTTVIIVVCVAPARADAITLREIIELTRAGVGEDVLLALIEVDQRVFPTDPSTLTMLKEAGVSERVVVAMVKSGRTPAPQPERTEVTAPDPPAPQVIVVEHERPVVYQVAVPVAVPVYVAVGSRRHARFRDVPHSFPRTPFNPFGVSVSGVSDTVEPPKPREPVYWGWGGKLRPDAWTPNPK